MNCDSVFPQIFNINKQHCWIQTNDRAHSVNFRYSITVIKKIGEGGEKTFEKTFEKASFRMAIRVPSPSNRKFLIPR